MTQLSINDLVGIFRQVPESAFDDREHILSIFQTADIIVETLEPFLTWDSRRYTRNLVDKTPLYELIALCWNTGQSSSVHNHHDQNCWMAVPMGRLLVDNYHLVREVSDGKCQLERLDTVEITPVRPCAVDRQNPVHRVYNPDIFGERAVSLHLYSRPFDTCTVYSPELGTSCEVKLHYNTEFGHSSGRSQRSRDCNERA
jgi:cysteine dioxygenase